MRAKTDDSTAAEVSCGDGRGANHYAFGTLVLGDFGLDCCEQGIESRRVATKGRRAALWHRVRL